jgi:hypothetical protein
MAAANNTQVQRFVNERMRVRCEQIRALYLAIKDDISVIDDIYNALNQPTPTWIDDRPDGPPHLLVPSDVLAFNAAIHAFVNLVEGGDTSAFAGQYPIILKSCVRSVI